MSMHDTPASERVHIAFFGVRNAGKSSVVNAVTGQELSVVSDVKGTTTDPVRKTMELLPVGPVLIIDTPGIDDAGALGEERVRRTKKILNETDLAVLVVSAPDGLQTADRELLALFARKQIPFLIALNKTDLLPGKTADGFCRKEGLSETQVLPVSALLHTGIRELKEAIGRTAVDTENRRPLVADLVKPNDPVLLVVPIDKAAPKGRLILPQQMVIRGLLDAGAVPVIIRDTEYPDLICSAGGLSHVGSGAVRETCGPRPSAPGICMRPALVITDSQVFEKISAQTPDEIPLTSFSMIMARYRGNLAEAVRGAKAIRELQDGDTVLIAEGCTHHRQCGDIGTEKLPRWLEGYTGKKLNYATASGRDFPEDLRPYRLVIHCGGCMLNEKEMLSRTNHAVDEGIPMTNFGVAIAEMHGILDRCVKPLL
ncbi:MAG: GTP-binding protein [Eubacterium sp.]|nr:GTP-binding protein [Eubacterium sp.]